mmetsp:Transcript_25983/g.53999  ORF Transcript_25983/g.53999 Transcript_25983/m.53999 type:complete len:218 (+) Transcript_25983:381-1034(+)
MDERMKKSSTKTTPNGRTPPISTLGAAFMYHTCSGTCLGIALVRTGCSIALRRKPSQLPKKTSGRDRPNQKSRSATRVLNGTAPVALSPQISRFRMKNTAKTTPGKMVAVMMVFLRRSVPAPLNILQKTADTYPAGAPMHTNIRIIAMSSDPRLLGERKPNTAKAMVKQLIPRTCTPLPMKTASKDACFGGLNTSPNTSFHPVSSLASSLASSLCSS